MTAAPNLLTLCAAALRSLRARPRILLLLLALNVAAALILVAPLRGLLAQEMDSNLYGDLLARAPSFHWFASFQRLHPEALGNWGGFLALVSDGSDDETDLLPLSGLVAGVVGAGLLLFWGSALLHIGFLATYHPERPPELSRFAAATAYFAAPTSALTLLAALSYALIFWLFFVESGKLLQGVMAGLDNEWFALALVWVRLAITWAGLLAVKVFFDLARVALVERASRNAPLAGLMALREFLLHGPRYFLLALLNGGALALLSGLWWLLPGRITPQNWLLLLLLFVFQQLFLAGRIALRLAYLATVQGLFRGLRAPAERVAYKVEPPSRSEHLAR